MYDILDYGFLGKAFVTNAGLVKVEYLYRNNRTSLGYNNTWESSHVSTGIWTSYPNIALLKEKYGIGSFKAK